MALITSLIDHSAVSRNVLCWCVYQFENNVRLSAARAQEVFFRLRDQLVDAGTELGCLDENFVVSGRGEAAPRDKAHPDDPSNRRLVIRVRGDLKLQ